MAGWNTFALGIAKYLFRLVADHLWNCQVVERVRDGCPGDWIGEDKREVAAHCLVAGEFAGGGLAQRLPVESVEVQFADEDGLLELALAGLVGVELAEVADGEAVDDGSRRAAGMEPLRHESGVDGQGVDVVGAGGELGEEFFDRAFEVCKNRPAAGCWNGLLAPRWPVAPKANAGRSSTLSVVPENAVPSSKMAMSSTSRLRLPASMVSIPGTSDGRSMPASSLSGLPILTAESGCGANAAASAAEQKVLETASFQPRASSVRRRVCSFSA